MMMAPGGTPEPPEARGRGPPSSSSLTSSLDGRRVCPLVLGSHGVGGARAPPRLDLSLYLYLFLRSQILPFHRFLYSRRSVTLIGLKFWHDLYPEISFLGQKKGCNRLTGWPWGSGVRPPASWAPRASSHVDFSCQKSYIFQKNLRLFLFRLDSVWYGYFAKQKTCNKQELALGTGSIC